MEQPALLHRANADLLLDELNVKRVDLLEDAGALVTRTVKLDLLGR